MFSLVTVYLAYKQNILGEEGGVDTASKESMLYLTYAYLVSSNTFPFLLFCCS